MPRKRFRVGRSTTGLGLFAIAEITKGATIAVYGGERISTDVAAAREKRGARYIFEIDKNWSIDGSPRSNLARYANHSCRPNAEADLVRGKMILRAIRRIRPDEEITYDYGKEYFDLFFGPTKCLCVKCTERRRKPKRSKPKRRKPSGAKKPLPAKRGKRPPRSNPAERQFTAKQ